MGTTKQPEGGSSLRRFWSALTKSGSSLVPSAAAIGLTLVIMLGGSILAWRTWGPQVVAQPKYRLSAKSLVVPPQPEWVPGDIRLEVVRDGSLAGASILEPDLAIRVARAFEVHSWVAKVRRVSKHFPDRIVVDLEYRRPVAMVEVDRHVFAVDALGVVLPSDYFLDHPDEVRRYPRILVGDAGPIGPEGSAWGDPRVAGAARIAELLVDAWPKLGLYRITVQDGRSASSNAEPVYLLMTKNFGRVLWGHGAGKETHGEPPASAKATSLLAFVERHGELESQGADFLLDLTERRPLALPPKPVRIGKASPSPTDTPRDRVD